jgi:hypothetical protein
MVAEDWCVGIRARMNAGDEWGCVAFWRTVADAGGPMKVLTVDESASWLAGRRLSLERAHRWGADHHLAIPDAYRRLRFDTPQRPAGQVSLAHLLARWFGCRSAFLLVNVAALFEPHQLEAFLSLRRYYGDSRWVDGVPGGATPGHLFGDGHAEDQRNVREFLLTMMAFAFEGYFVQDDGGVVLWVADEIIDIAARDPAHLLRPQEIAQLLDLKVHHGAEKFQA